MTASRGKNFRQRLKTKPCPKVKRNKSVFNNITRLNGNVQEKE